MNILICIYVLTAILTFSCIVWDEHDCYGQVKPTVILSVLVIALIPAFNLLILIWFLYDTFNITVTRR